MATMWIIVGTVSVRLVVVHAKMDSFWIIVPVWHVVGSLEGNAVFVMLLGVSAVGKGTLSTMGRASCVVWRWIGV